MRIVTLLLTCSAIATLHAAVPVRHILTKDELGVPMMLPLSGSAYPGKSGVTCFPSARHRDSRSFITNDPSGLGVYGQSAGGVLASIGNPSIPVIMVEFSDVHFQPNTTEEFVRRYFNEKGFNADQSWGGSVRDYFVDQSYGKFSPNFHVVGKATMPKERAYYGQNSGNNKQLNMNELYSSAIQQMQRNGVSFEQFKSQGGDIPLVLLYIAGATENSSLESGSEDYIWAHFRELSTQEQGDRFRSYLAVGELISFYKSEKGNILLDDRNNPIVDHREIEGPGVKCHELCHALGLPDVYDVNGAIETTPDYFDLMDYGQYCITMGERPMGLSAYERNCLGWLKIEELKDQAGYFVLQPLNSVAASGSAERMAAQAYVLRNPDDARECYILENRQPSTWFPERLGRGMLVYHVDYDETAWDANRVNVDASRLRLTVFPADGKTQTHNNGRPSDFRGDYFPGDKNITAWSSQSSPMIRWRTGEDKRGLYGIAIKAPLNDVGFAFIDETLSGIVTKPVNSEAAHSFKGCFSVDGRWTKQPTEGGLYIIDGQKVLFSPR